MANVIYGIVDPTTNELRYIGQTVNFMKRRSAHHRSAIKSNNNTHVYNWLRSLYNKSILPEFLIIEECVVEDLDKLEIFYIEYFKMLGCNLTNSAVGGSSKRGFKQPESMKEKVSVAMEGNTWNIGRKALKETKEKMRSSHLGMTHFKDSKLKMATSKVKDNPVLQLSKEGVPIKPFPSAYAASKELHINRKSIGNVLAGMACTAGGYRWVYNNI